MGHGLVRERFPWAFAFLATSFAACLAVDVYVRVRGIEGATVSEQFADACEEWPFLAAIPPAVAAHLSWVQWREQRKKIRAMQEELYVARSVAR